jgi:predicted TIM-barrel fold metal-dependent hydrolase
MDRMQGNYEMFGMQSHQLRKTPAEYVRSEQLYFAADPEETTLPAVIDAIGPDRLVIGSDYCHPEGMCPFTMKALADRDDIGQEARRKILYDNPKRLYRL